MSKPIYIKERENLCELIGRFVYLAYTPARCGVIIDAFMHGSGRQPILCKVEWLNTTKTYPDKITEHRINSLNDFTELVNEHKNKYFKHEKTLGKLQNLQYNKKYGIWVLKKGNGKSFDVIHVEKFSEEPSQKDYDKLKKQYPNDIVEVCPTILNERNIK